MVRTRDDGSMPNVKIFGTGGTIASSGLTPTNNSGYSINLNIEELVDSIPGLSDVANIEFDQLFNLGSNELTSFHLLKLRQEIINSLTSENFDGMVVTHGSDTLEETAFFLELTLDTDIPICITGSMRPRTSISYDGYMNLYTSVVAAANTSSRSRGVFVMLNDRITSGIHVTKGNSNSLDTFKNNEQGSLGVYVDRTLNWFVSPPYKHWLTGLFAHSKKLDQLAAVVAEETIKKEVDSSSSFSSSAIPEVMIFYAYQSLNPYLVEIAVNSFRLKGIVLACTGPGSWTDEGNNILKKLSLGTGIPVVYSTRNLHGIVPVGILPSGDQGFPGAIASGYLNPQKARILLQLSLINGDSLQKISDNFKLACGGSRNN